jgi:nucleotide-binding universal stress UspA family protein
MSIFPTRILLATDGLEEATLAAQAAIDLANKTGSELHVVHVRISLYSGLLPSLFIIPQARRNVVVAPGRALRISGLVS